MRKGIAEVVGVRRRVLVGFSRRRAEIEAALAERGTSGARAAEAAALATRSPKSGTPSLDELVREWRARAAELGLGRDELELIVGRARSVAVDEAGWRRVYRQLEAPHGLTHRKATFTRAEVIQAICEQLPAGARVDVAAIEAAADRFLASERAVALVPDGEAREGDQGFRRRDGRIVPVDRQQLRYSTPAQLALEQRLIDRALDSRAGEAGLADGRQVARALAARPTLSDEQRAMVKRLCRDGDGIAVVAGRAGTGKTFALGAAREAWQAAGHPVLGVATARRAAAELRDGAGIQSTSTFALLADLRGGAARLPRGCVLVVDEAGMVPTREIAELAEHVGAVEGKLVLVGDHRQLPELQAGGVFRALVARGLAIELTENVRQVHAWERRALDQLRDGQPEPALAAYAEHDRLTVAATGDAARERLVADWAAAGDPDGAVMIAQRRADVADLNARARSAMRAAGALGPELETAAGAFAVGDVVVVKRNDTRRGVNNGDRARVTAIEPDSGAVVIERRGQQVRLDRRFLAEPTTAGDPPLVHGYAITGHIAQGLTVDQAFVLAGEGIDREWAYVALSRGRDSNRLYLAAAFDDDRAEYAPARPPTTDPIKRLARQLESSSAQVLAIDTGRRAEPDPVGASAEALERATDERRRLEGRSLGWLPGRRRELEAAREREADARRARLEAAHAARPIEAEQDFAASVERAHARQAERATERVLRHDRGIGREL